MTLRETILANVAEIRTLAAQFLTDTCVVRRVTNRTVVDGENIITYASPGTTTNCRLIIRSGSESINVAAQERLVSQSQFSGIYRMQLPFGTDINLDDHIEYTDISTDKLYIFEVIFVPPHNEMTGAYIISVREVK